MDKSNIHVYVGMSGGVDSSVTAALLKNQGYKVTGVYMKNWTTDLPGFVCPWADDLADAKRVAVQLDIPFKVFDFQKEYKQQVVDYMIAEYQAGRTPNPDIMCNQEIKFDLFLKSAIADGADMIATGHYARVQDGKLLAGLDKNKDQSYFLYRVTEDALRKTLLPVGELTKPEVREEARKLGLVTADKKDSQGICFVGKIGIKEFLQNYVDAEPGDIIDKKTGKVIGQHDGAIYYTIGQRHGLHVGGGLPYYVVGKDMDKNVVYVTTDLNDENLWKSELTLTNPHWINESPRVGETCEVRARYRAALVSAEILRVDANEIYLKLSEPERALTAGQSAVLYRGDQVIGGGIVV
ncbi:MAG TPA: tRNA 2-thiouridine(34) synthase MnmA [Candidatus Saccharimonadales bacterium]|nr:tRNA 2-thiouridine(34) synthase MnmA [Candidatus Saccharimonadales bacterium]